MLLLEMPVPYRESKHFKSHSTTGYLEKYAGARPVMYRCIYTFGGRSWEANLPALKQNLRKPKEYTDCPFMSMSDSIDYKVTMGLIKKIPKTGFGKANNFFAPLVWFWCFTLTNVSQM